MIQRIKPQKYHAVIQKKTPIAPYVYEVTFALVEPKEVQFQAGQTFMLTVGDGINRTMSIASPPSETNTILMCHDVSPGGPASKWTLSHKEGDEAVFMAPLGMFTLQKDTYRKKILVATGTGIAPYRSMVLDYLHGGGTDDVTIYWGMRHEKDLYWVDEFAELSRLFPNFQLIVCMSQPSDAWTGKRGRVTAHVVENEPNIKGSDLYLCGNQKMIKDMEAQLSAAGVPSHQVYKELYF